ncbi:MAG TPA: hypothetical protein VH496_06580 [Mycobacterium sp.]
MSREAQIVNISIVAASSEGGGGPIGQIIGLTVFAVIVLAAMIWVGYMHRTRRITWLTRLAEAFGRRFKRPPWVALPLAMFIATIICALFGFIWDVSWHIGAGRDPGPLANPAHYFIVIGLGLMFVAGMTAVVLPYDKPGPAAVRITRDWYAPVGGIVMAACGLYALTGFPLDDIWHRLFGQDVTLWGPTHLMMIGGAGFSTISALLLEYEGRLATRDDPPQEGIGLKAVQYLGFGGIVIGLSVYQIEFDFGVPQFRLVFQPMLIVLAASVGLIAARMMMGRGAAILAAVFAIALRGVVALIVGPILGAPINWFPLYLGPAIIVELLALTPLLKRPVVFGALTGLAIATVGLWLESLWIGAVYHYPWPTRMWPEALAMAVPVGVVAGMCGAMLGMVFTGQRLPRRAISISIVVLTVLAVGGAAANGLQNKVPHDITANVKVEEASNVDGHRMVNVAIRAVPSDKVSSHPEWFSVLSWQGGLANDRGLVIDTLHRDGEWYRSDAPVPAWGKWKTLARLQDGYNMAAIPIYMAADPAISIPAPGGVALDPASVTPTGVSTKFQVEKNLLQREQNAFKPPAWLWPAGSLVVLVCTLAVIAGLAWGAGRINDRDMQTTRESPDVPEPTTPKVQA